MAGYSPRFDAGGTGTISLNILPGSAIRKAFLIAGRQGNAADLTVTLNDISYTFSSSNQASPTFQSPNYGGSSAVHIIDITYNIDPSVNSYSLVVPTQTGPSDRYNDFSLYVAYNNLSMAPVSAGIFLNSMDFDDVMNYSLNLSNAINTTSPVALSVMSGYICNNVSDGEKVKIGNYLLGTIGDPDVNSGTCGGPLGSFYYSNNTLAGLNDDLGNLAMADADALSDVRTKVSNNSTSISLRFTAVTTGNRTNAIWAVFVTYGSPSPLPVQLTEFSGKAEGNVNRLDWTTASEVNCDYFDVEESSDGFNYTTCGSMRGAGNSTQLSYYAFIDENPFPGATYYRLKQVDYDGQYHYSNPVVVSNNNYSTSTVDVYNLQGQMIISVKDFTDNYSLKNLSPGVYMLHYHSNQGLLVKKVICKPS